MQSKTPRLSLLEALCRQDVSALCLSGDCCTSIPNESLIFIEYPDTETGIVVVDQAARTLHWVNCADVEYRDMSKLTLQLGSDRREVRPSIASILWCMKHVRSGFGEQTQ